MRGMWLAFFVAFVMLRASAGLNVTDTAHFTLPTFRSQSREVTVSEGETALLPCHVQDSGVYPIVWRKGTRVLSAGEVITAVDTRFQLRRSSDQQARDLSISAVRPSDAGVYVCSLSTDPVMELSHELLVMYDPVLVTHPKSGEIIVGANEDAVLQCSAHGQPTPRLYWRTQVENAVTESGESTTKMTIPRIGRKMAGMYECVADNGRGRPAVGQLSVRVQHPPIIRPTTSSVHTAAGRHAQLECQVTADPVAKVEWRKQDGSAALSSRHHNTVRVETGGAELHVLHVRHVKDEDLDTYTCEASNKYGTDRARIVLTGVAEPVRITGALMSASRNSYTLSWQVTSYSQILEYKVAYRKYQVNSSMINGEERRDGAAPWREVIVPTAGAVADSDGVHRQEILLRHLQAGCSYHVYVQARNRHGWNAVSHMFRFSTLDNGPVMESRTGVAGSGIRAEFPSMTLSAVMLLFIKILIS